MTAMEPTIAPTTLQNPVLRIDTTVRGDRYKEIFSPSLSAPLNVNSSTPISPQDGRHHSSSTDRSLNESRKLLAHHLRQLDTRPMPPSVFEGFKTSSNTIHVQSLGEAVKAVVKLKRGRRDQRTQLFPAVGEDDDEDQEKDTFTTDVTFDLMTQLKDVLGMFLLFTPIIEVPYELFAVVSAQRGWQIFHDRYEIYGAKSMQRVKQLSAICHRRLLITVARASDQLRHFIGQGVAHSLLVEAPGLPHLQMKHSCEPQSSCRSA